MLVLSWLGAIVACLGYGVSSVLQSVAAKRSAEVVGLTGLVLIIKQVPYLLGWPPTHWRLQAMCWPCSGFRCSWSSRSSPAVSESPL